MFSVHLLLIVCILPWSEFACLSRWQSCENKLKQILRLYVRSKQNITAEWTPTETELLYSNREDMSENYIYLKKINTTTPIWLQVYTSIFRNYLFKYTGLRGVEGGVAHHPCNLQRYKKKRERQVGIKFICKLSKPCRMFYKTINNQRRSLPHSWHFN